MSPSDSAGDLAVSGQPLWFQKVPEVKYPKSI